MNVLIAHLAYFHFVAFLVSLAMTLLIFQRCGGTRVNRIAAALFAMISLWTLSLVFRHGRVFKIEAVRFFINLGAPGWIGMSFFFFAFAAELTGKVRLSGFRFLLLALPPVVFLVLQFAGRLLWDVSETARAAYGWALVYPSPPAVGAFYLFMMAYFTAGLVLIFLGLKSAETAREAKRLRLVFVTGLFSVSAGSLTDIFLPLLTAVDFPGLADIFALVWMAGMYRAITKYGLLKVTPEAAASRIIETMTDALFLTDGKERIRFVNSAAVRYTGVTRNELEGRSLSDYVVCRTGAEFDAGEYAESFEGILKGPDLAVPVLVSRSAMKGEDGEALGFVFVVKDIADLRAFEEELKLMLRENIAAKEEIQKLLGEKDLLLHEVHHRNKNNMNVISSLLSVQASGLKDPGAAAALDIAGSRVRSMMIMYDKLYRSADFRTISADEYFSDLLADLEALYKGVSSFEIEKRIEDLPLASKVIFPAGIIINELVTNALKYAFPSGRKGRVVVGFGRRGEHSLCLSVEDDGIGLPASALDGEGPSGFGLHLVKTLALQLGGDFEPITDGAEAGKFRGIKVVFPR